MNTLDLSAVSACMVLAWLTSGCAAPPALQTLGTVVGATGGVTVYKRVDESGPKFAPEFVLIKINNCKP